MQDFSLGSLAQGTTLSSIEITSVAGNGQSNGSSDGSPILLGVTVDGAAVSAAPEPAAWLLMIAGIGCMGLMLRRGKMAEGLRVSGALPT